MLSKKSTEIKLKLIFLPFLGLSLLTALLYNIVRWTLDIYLDTWPFKDSVWDLIIPILLSMAVVFMGMRPRIRLLRFKLFEENSANIFYLVMVLSLFPPLSISQVYLSKVSYSVIDINNVDEARQYPKQKYFRVADFNVEKPEVVSHITTEVTGKYQSELLVYLYLATPFSDANNIWLGQCFRIVIDNNLPEHNKRQQFEVFIKTSKREYKDSGAPLANYFEYLRNPDIKSGYLYAIESSPPRYQSTPLILVSKIGTLSGAAVEELVKAIRFFVIGMVVFLAMVLRAKIDKKSLKDFKKKSYE